MGSEKKAMVVCPTLLVLHFPKKNGYPFSEFRPLWVSVTAVVCAAALATTGLLRGASLVVF